MSHPCFRAASLRNASSLVNKLEKISLLLQPSLPQVLGKGSFGCVRLGLYQGRKVAVKVIEGAEGEELVRYYNCKCVTGNETSSLMRLTRALSGPFNPSSLSACPFGDPQGRQDALILREVDVLGRCDHPCVVKLLAACVAPPR